MGKTTLPIDVDCHVFLLFSFERMKFDLLVLCVFCSSCWFHSGAVPNFSWTWDVGIAEQYHKPPWWWLHLNTSRCSSFPLAANLGKFTLITSNHFFEKLPQSICAPISRPLKILFSTPLCVCDGLEKDALMLSPDIVLLVFSWPPTVMKQIIQTHTQNSWVVIFLFCNQQGVMVHASYLIIIVWLMLGTDPELPKQSSPQEAGSPGPLSPPLSFGSLAPTSAYDVGYVCECNRDRHT